MGKKTRAFIPLSVIALGYIAQFGTTPVVHAARRKTSWQYVSEKCDLSDEKKSDKSVGTLEGVSGDWLTEGTEAYEVAKKIFELFTEEYGTSGAFAAGVLANVKQESGFRPDILEGGARVGMNTPTGPNYNTSKPKELGGGGLFQFTPYTKYTESEWWKGRPGSDGWAIENQVDAVLGLEFWNRKIEPFFVVAEQRSGGDIVNTISSAEELLSMDDAVTASIYFQLAYERPGDYHPERNAWAKQANAVFNKDNIKADPSRWKFGSDSTNGGTSTKKEKTNKKDKCASKKEKKGTPADWGNDGTGSWPSGVPFEFRPDNSPDAVREYVLDPTLVGMKFGSSEGWTNPGDQCAHFAPSFLYALWEKDGKPNPNAAGAAGHENGGEFAEVYARKYGGEWVDTPSKGAIGSAMPQSTLTNDSHGHVWIVSHVFKDGSTLVIEQNYSNGYTGVGSGAAIHESCTWNYRYIPKKTLDGGHAKYFTPSSVGYKPSEKIAK